MIRAIAIDDEPLALKVIENFCKDSNEIDLVKTFTKPQEAHGFIDSNSIEVVFLDVKMPSISGIEFAKTVKDKLIVLTTAFSEYAVEGFEINAVDYLLKPFTKERFLQSVSKIKKTLLMTNNLEETCFYIKADYALNRIEFKDLLYIEGLDDYLKIHLAGRKPIVARMTMKGILELLPEHKFIRVHRSYIVPLARIICIKSKIICLPNVEIPIGNSFEDRVKSAFGKQ